MKTVVTIKGTHCESCKALIEDVCSEISGVVTCTVDYKTGRTEIEHTVAVDWALLQREIAQVGSYTIDRAGA